MNPDDRRHVIAARIADGSGVDWATTDASATDADSEERGVLDQLKAIAALAALHRAPAERAGDDPSLTGKRWGALTLIAPIGAGRFGQVYRAWDARLQRQVALKALHAASPSAAASPTRAIEEARLLARVRHPNVLAVYGAECIDEQVGIWTEFIEGRTLESLVEQNGPMPADEVVAIGIDLCRALSAVHHAGLLHRDIKAQNVMRETGGRIVLMDFGTGHDLSRVPAQSGDLSGTPLYLAPEIFAGAAPSEAGDIYALAVLLHFLATGQYPVSGATLGDVSAAHRDEAAVQLTDRARQLPSTLRVPLERGLAKNPETRFRSTGDFEKALTPRQHMGATNLAWWKGRPAWLALSFAIVVAGLAFYASGRTGRLESSLLKTTAPPYAVMGRPSHDGRFVPFVGLTGDLVVWEVRSGHTNVVATGFSDNDVMLAVNPLMSPNGDRIVYAEPRADGGFDLSVRNRDGTLPRTLLAHEAAQPEPLDWSRDGRTVLCLLKQKNNTADLVLIPAEGGRPKWVYSGPYPPFLTDTIGASLSPDGRFVVTLRSDGQRTSPRDLILIDVTHPDQPPRVLLKGQRGDRYPMWMPDGRRVLFVRLAGSTNDTDGWMLQVVNGVRDGEPRLAIPTLGASSMPSDISVTDDGSLYRPWSSIFGEVFVAGVDSDGSRVRPDAVRISERDIGQHTAPAWSPDGRSIAYLTITEPEPGFPPGRALTIKDVASGTARTIEAGLAFVAGFAPTWTRDNASLLVKGWDADHRAHVGLYRVDVRTGATSVLLPSLPNPTVACLPNGREFAYVDKTRGLVLRDLQSGAERPFDASRPVFPDAQFVFDDTGRVVAFRHMVDHVPAIVVQRQGEPPREIRRFETNQWPALEAWHRRSGQLIYALYHLHDPASLWRIPAEGGPPRDIHLSVDPDTTTPFSLSPDEDHVAYTRRTLVFQLWITTPGWDARHWSNVPR